MLVTKKNKTLRKSKIADIIAIILCLLGAGIAFRLFWGDLNATLTKQNVSPIGTITFKHKTAQRRFSDRVVWEMLKNESPVYSADLIHTADFSEASIHFGKEGEIELGENSMVQIYDTTEGTKVDLISGTINLKTGDRKSTLLLVTSGVTVEIDEGSSVGATAGVTGSGGIQVLTGTASITTLEGKQNAGAGQSLVVDSEGHTETTASVTLLNPSPSQVYLTSNGGALVNFVWKENNFTANDIARFQIAKDQRFTTLVQSADVRSASTQSAGLQAGNYWWRVYPVPTENDTGQDSAPETTMSNKVAIVDSKIPSLITPALNSEVTYRSTTPQVRFKWDTGYSGGDEDSPVSEYQLQIADNTLMENPVVQVAVRGSFYTVNDLADGTWYWRVNPVYPASWIGGGTNTGVSDISTFRITKNAEQLTAVQVTMPNDGVFINIENNSPPILFSWKTEKEAFSYNFEIADNLEFVNPVITNSLTENRWTYNTGTNTLRPAVYFWRVNYVDSSGSVSPWSQTRYFSAREGNVIFESVYPPDNWSVSEADFTGTRFLWKSNLSQESRFQISNVQNFSSILVDETASATSYDISSGNRSFLGVGTFWWRVTVNVNDNITETAARKFTVQSAGRVELLTPPNGTQIPGLQALHTPPVITWTALQTPDFARIVVRPVSNAQDFEATPVFVQDNPGRTVPLPPLGEGAYSWTVTAQSASGFDISPPEPFLFRVLPIPLLQAPTLVAPQENYTLNAQTLRQNRSVNFSWRQVAGANSYVVSIYRQGNVVPIFVTPPLRSTNWTLNDLTILDAGVFTWQVEAVLVSQSGVIEQHGNVSRRNWTVDIMIPQSPHLNDEEVYGF
ncbi:hypothetical protein FACS1894190_11390 [Spirochaetia bacterium]|nr:hypothetical protein FACS1894190_11390 [Spirochaetia bacterium]